MSRNGETRDTVPLLTSPLSAIRRSSSAFTSESIAHAQDVSEKENGGQFLQYGMGFVENILMHSRKLALRKYRQHFIICLQIASSSLLSRFWITS